MGILKEEQTIRAGAKRIAMEKILGGDLDFHGESSRGASHALHAFAAKFPPQLPRLLITSLTEPGEVVLDPMMGSGTTVVEAAILGRHAIGVDIDPLAVTLCRVKTTPIRTGRLVRGYYSAIYDVVGMIKDRDALHKEIEQRFDQQTLDFLNYWFFRETQEELIALILAIEKEQDQEVADFLRVVFSSLIITKSGGVSRARDLAHTRPHRDTSKAPRNAIEQFKLRARKAIAAMAELPSEMPRAELHRADARNLPVQDCSVDLVVTSPPYANAIDYMRAHKFSLVWFGRPIQSLSKLRSCYVGSEKCLPTPARDLPSNAESQVATLCSRDPRKARILRKYFLEMADVLTEIQRVLRPGGAAGIVVGPSTMRGISIQTHIHISEIAEEVGFDLVGIGERRLDRDKRMMPARKGHQTREGIEQRIHREFLIALSKP